MSGAKSKNTAYSKHQGLMRASHQTNLCWGSCACVFCACAREWEGCCGDVEQVEEVHIETSRVQEQKAEEDLRREMHVLQLNLKH